MTPTLSVTFWMNSAAPAPSPRSAPARTSGPASARATFSGTSGASASSDSRSRISAAAIRLALLLTCGYALWPPGVRIASLSQNMAFSPNRTV